jgi:FG-GAP repeat
VNSSRSCPTRVLGLLALVLAAPLRAADFNGDGYPDLAIGCRGEWVNGQQEAGAVHVLFGGPACLATFTEQVLTESSFGAVPAAWELFGLAVTSGDFDGDGFDDIAICAEGETVNGFDAAGTVFVTYGSESGFDLSRKAEFNQDTKGIKDKVEPGNFFFEDLSAEGFGRTMASGDFNADGFDDLALYVVESFGSKKKPQQFAGAVHVIKGSDEGLTVKGNKLFRQGKGGVKGKAASDAKFGWALAVADFNQDAIDDLAVGAPGELLPGSVIILLGKAKKGLTGKKSVLIDETAAGGTPNPAKAHHFGESLAVGAFAGGAPQLAIGAPLLDVGGSEYAGGVYVLEIAADLSVSSAELITRATEGVDGELVAIAQFGAALAAGDFDADGDDDLAVGCPYDLVGTEDDAGSVTLLTGSPTGLFAGDLMLHEDVTDVPDVAEEGDTFGGTLMAADYDDDGDADLIIGVYRETVGAVPTAGGVLVIEGSGTTLLDLTQSHWLDKSLAEIAGSPTGNDTFGSALGR